MIDERQLLKIAVFNEGQYFYDYMMKLESEPYEDQVETMDEWYAALAKECNIRSIDVDKCSDEVLKNSILGKTNYIEGALEEYARRKGVNFYGFNGHKPPYDLESIANVLLELKLI